MADDYPELVQRGLRLKKIGNKIMSLLGGREIHPINPKVGGFYRVPTRTELNGLIPELEWATEAAAETAEFAGSIDFPDFERDYEFVALRHPEEYAILGGRLVSNKGLDIPIEEFLTEFEEFHVEHSTSLHALHKRRGSYLVGPMARYNLNFEKLGSGAQEAARDARLEPTCRNPFKSLLIRCVEMVHACEVALDIIESYEAPDEPAVSVQPRAGSGTGCTEAPRGICWHHYTIDDGGLIQKANIIPPTSQNQRSMEEDMWHFIQENLELPDDELQWKCEQGIRNYDPCISCSCHFLKLEIDRG